MKTIICALYIGCIINLGYSQEWHKYPKNDLGFTYTLTQSDYGFGRHFRINPYDNSLWVATNYNIQTIDTNGVYKSFRFSNTPVIHLPSQFISFDFLPNKVFIHDEYYGIYLYENDVFSMLYNTTPNLCYGLTTHGDSLYILKENAPVVKWAENSFSDLFSTGSNYPRKLIIKNNWFWFSRGIGSSGLYLYEQNGVQTAYDQSLIMDYLNYDFKFSPYNDTLYVAGSKGLSMLHNFTFFDSIAPDNTTNMPSGSILDFEFDTNDNIWALFGSDAETATSIAHYDQVTKNWDYYYDANNTNLNFDTYCSIELDDKGNVWMVNEQYIHVLNLSTIPTWLSIKEKEFTTTLSVYPNPSKELININSEESFSEIYITDQMGKKLKTFNPHEKSISVIHFPNGCYFLEIITDKGEKHTVKLLLE